MAECQDKCLSGSRGISSSFIYYSIFLILVDYLTHGIIYLHSLVEFFAADDSRFYLAVARVFG